MLSQVPFDRLDNDLKTAADQEEHSEQKLLGVIAPTHLGCSILLYQRVLTSAAFAWTGSNL